jgi:hypothetical protein
MKTATLLLITCLPLAAQELEKPIVARRLEIQTLTEDWAARQKLLATWREVEGEISKVDSKGWCEFEGVVEQHHSPTTIRVRGRYRERWTGDDFEGVFIVVNFPFTVADGDAIGTTHLYLAKPTGVYNYTSIMGGPRQLRKLDYGATVPAPPARELTPQEKELARAAAEKAQAVRDLQAQESDARLLKFQRDQAEKGMPSAQLALGMRYLKGDGVEKDEAAARAWLQKAAAQNDPVAKRALANLGGTR